MSAVAEKTTPVVRSRSVAKRLLRSNEFTIAAAIIAVSVIITAINPAFLSVSNIFDLLRLLTVTGILSLGVLLVMISGGVDVSFPAIANVSSFAAATILVAAQFDGSGIIFYLVAAPIGIAFGLFNGFFVARFQVPTLIVTLGTSSLFYGGALFFLGGQSIFALPAGTIEFSQASLLTVPNPNGAGTTSLHPAVVILVVLAVLVWLLLNHTTLGRQIYALGGNATVAERSGVDVRRVHYFIYATVGGLASIAGVTFATLYRNANPVGLQGSELAVIAAVVLGGALITGGRGTVVGALLGVLLIGIVQNSLVLVGLPATWQQVAVGVVLIIGTGVPALRALRQRRAATGGS
ncbi:ABC transporter permease [Salinibacterium sp. NYA9b]